MELPVPSSSGAGGRATSTRAGDGCHGVDALSERATVGTQGGPSPDMAEDGDVYGDVDEDGDVGRDVGRDREEDAATAAVGNAVEDVGDMSAPAPAPATLRLLPLVQFYDSMHVASTRWYLSRVFGRRRYINLPGGRGFPSSTSHLNLRRFRH